MESIQPAGPQPPWNEKAQSKIQLSLQFPDEQKKRTVTHSCRIFLEMLQNQYPQETWTRIYTDGSAIEATRNGGAGVLIHIIILEMSFVNFII